MISSRYLSKYNTLSKIISGVFLIFACAQISIPIKPVPITMQTIAIMLIGILYNKDIGLKIIITYLISGAAGLPVFANLSGGIDILIGPRGGYLISYIPCIYVINLCKSRLVDHSVKSLTLLCLIGNGIIYFFGVSYLATLIGLHKAFELGFMPFILSGIIKSVLLGYALSYFKKFKND